MKSITVLMSTYNGEKYLREQIDSILSQTGVTVHLLVRDDGSSDGTKAILESYSGDGKLHWYTGSNKGAAYSFLDLLKNAPEDDYFAFSDQDDIWDSEKLLSATKVLEQYPSEEIVLYSCSSRIVDKDNNIMHVSSTKPPVTTYIDSLIHNNNQGCTMVFSQALWRLLKKYNGNNLFMHDDLAMKVCLATGGTVYKDPVPYMGYRQHGNNVIGTGESFGHSLRRRISSLVLQSCERSKELKDIFHEYKEQIPVENRDVLEEIAFYKERRFGKLKVILDRRIKASDKKTTRHFHVGILLGFF